MSQCRAMADAKDSAWRASQKQCENGSQQDGISTTLQAMLKIWRKRQSATDQLRLGRCVAGKLSNVSSTDPTYEER